MPMSAAEARSKWNQLEKAINVIFRRNGSSLSFMVLYQIAFELVKGSQGEIIATGLRRTFEEYLDRETKLSVHNARADEQFLQLLSLFWNDHLLSIEMIRNMLMAYDSKYANITQKVHGMGVRLFDDIILSQDICEHVTTRAVSLISGEREGRIIETDIIQDISQMLISIGDLTYYVENIENPFLLDTTTYYDQKAKQFLDQKNVMSYLQAVNKLLQEEQLRVKKHFHPTTKAKLIRLFDKILIDDQLEILSNIKDGNIKYLLENKLVSKEPYVYAILKRVKSGIKFIEEAIRKYMVETIKQYNSDPNIADNPEIYIETILQLRVYINSVTQEAAITNILFQTKIDNDFASAFNMHTKCAKFLAHYLNCKLKKGNSGDEFFIENHLEDIIVLFRYLEEKDIFENVYKRDLSTRLLNETSVSKEAEVFVINKLKEEVGYMFTQNMEKLLKDRELWDDAATDFSVYKLSKQNINDPSNISVHVITSGFWPIPEINNVIFPRSCQDSIETFKQYYNEKFSGRKIDIHPLIGKAELKCVE